MAGNRKREKKRMKAIKKGLGKLTPQAHGDAAKQDQPLGKVHVKTGGARAGGKRRPVDGG